MVDKLNFLFLLKEKRGLDIPFHVRYKYFPNSFTEEEIMGLDPYIRAINFPESFSKEEIMGLNSWLRYSFFKEYATKEDRVEFYKELDNIYLGFLSEEDRENFDGYSWS